MLLGPFARCFRWCDNRPHGAFFAGRLRAIVLAPPLFGLTIAIAKMIGHPGGAMNAWQFVLLVLAPGIAAFLVLGHFVDRTIRRLGPKDKPSAVDWLIIAGAPVLGLVAVMAFMR